MKDKKVNQVCNILMFIAILSCSCAPSYIPNVVNTPLFNNKGEFHASVNGGLSGFDPQLAFAVTDHIGVMANGSFSDRTSDSSDSYHHHKFVEIGAGYYTNLGTSGKAETFAGFGMGELKTKWENSLWEPFTKVKSKRYFIQQDFGISTRIFDGSLGARFVYVDIYEGLYNSQGLFVEPVLTAKVGYEFIKVVTQFGFSLPLNSKHIEFANEPVLFSIGIQVTLGRKNKD